MIQMPLRRRCIAAFRWLAQHLRARRANVTRVAFRPQNHLVFSSYSAHFYRVTAAPACTTQAHTRKRLQDVLHEHRCLLVMAFPFSTTPLRMSSLLWSITTGVDTEGQLVLRQRRSNVEQVRRGDESGLDVWTDKEEIEAAEKSVLLPPHLPLDGDEDEVYRVCCDAPARTRTGVADENGSGVADQRSRPTCAAAMFLIRDPLRPSGVDLQAAAAEMDEGKDTASLLDLFDDLLPSLPEASVNAGTAATAAARVPNAPLQAGPATQNYSNCNQRGCSRGETQSSRNAAPAAALRVYSPQLAAGVVPHVLSAPSGLLLDDCQARAVDLALRGHNLFITGGAGTGKSQTLHHIVAALRTREKEEFKQFRTAAAAAQQMRLMNRTAIAAEEEEGNEKKCNRGCGSRKQKNGWWRLSQKPRNFHSAVYVTATTGLAAVQLNGSTIHSFAGIGFGQGRPEKLIQRVRKSSIASRRWRRCRVLIIDEVSMLDAATFESLDYVARRIRRQASLPFGGIQVILCGDFHQLAPVIRKSDVSAHGDGPTALPLWPAPVPSPSTVAPLTAQLKHQNSSPASTAMSQPFVISNLDAFLDSTTTQISTPPPQQQQQQGSRRTKAATMREAQQQVAATAFAHATGCLYAFQTVAWQRLQLLPVVLNTSHRQASDLLFRRILDEVRRGELSTEGCRVLATRCIVDDGDGYPRLLTDARRTWPSAAPPPACDGCATASIRLCATNSAVDERNDFFFAKLPPRQPYFCGSQQRPRGQELRQSTTELSPLYMYYAYDTQVVADQQQQQRRCPLPRDKASASPIDDNHLLPKIALKIGTRVMVMCNLSVRFHLVNGTVGEVVGFLHPLEMVALVHWTMMQRHHRLHQNRKSSDNRHHASRDSHTRGGVEKADEEPVPSWVEALRRRGGFTGDEADVLNCVDTSQGTCFGDLWWKMKKEKQKAAAAVAAPPSPTPSASSRDDPSGLPGSSNSSSNSSNSGSFDFIEADGIPFNAFFSVSHFTDLHRVLRQPIRFTAPLLNGPLHSNGRKEWPGARRELFCETDCNSCPPWSAPEQQHEQWCCCCCLRNLTPAERQQVQLPVIRFDSPRSAFSVRRGFRYAMIAPVRHNYGEGDGSSDGSGSEGVAQRTQLPLRYAWALTVHKSQGLTLHPVQVDMENISSVGQAYVALSRAPSLDQLFILNFNPAVITASPVVRQFYESLTESYQTRGSSSAEVTSQAQTMGDGDDDECTFSDDPPRNSTTG